MNIARPRFKSVPGIAVIFLLALVVRLLWILLIDVNPVSDSKAYDILAQNMVNYGVYGFTPDEPGAYWAVGAPAIYAAAYLVFGVGPSAVIFVNLISSLLALWFIYALGRLYFDEITGRLAALIFALWPTIIQFSTIIASELHFMAAMTAGLYFWERARKPGYFWLHIGFSGLCFAAAVYIRPVAQLIPVVLLILSILRFDRPLWRPLLQTIIVLAVIFVAVTPWSARNERVFGAKVSIATNFGPNLWMGNHPGTLGGYTPLPDWADNLGEIERGKRLKEEAISYIKSDPGAFIARTAIKAIKLHSSETIGVVWNSQQVRALLGPAGESGLKVLSTLYWFVFLFLALAAVPYLTLGHKMWKVILAPPFILIAYLVAVHAVIVVGDRYHLPEIPFIAMLAATVLNRLFFTAPEDITKSG